MKTCGTRCVTMCNFCKHYKDNGGELRTIDTFEGEGICDVSKKNINAIDGRKCNDFDCFICN